MEVERHGIFLFIIINFVLNFLMNFFAGQSGGLNTSIITILRFCMCISWNSSYELDFAISCFASTDSVALI